jgi:hypothetical protein
VHFILVFMGQSQTHLDQRSSSFAQLAKENVKIDDYMGPNLQEKYCLNAFCHPYQNPLIAYVILDPLRY